MFKYLKRSEQCDGSEKLKRVYNAIFAYNTFFTHVSVFFVCFNFTVSVYIITLKVKEK